MRRLIGLTVVSALCLPLAACEGTEPDEPLPRGTITFTGAGGPIRMPVEIAETADARRRGLMGRASLAPDAGMAFLFDEPGDGGFWMKDTLIPLSIAFWGEDGTIVALLDMAPCRHDPCPVYSPGATYVGAVEANEGYFHRHGVSKGDRIALTR